MTRNPRRKPGAIHYRECIPGLGEPAFVANIQPDGEIEPIPWVNIIGMYRRMLPARLRGNSPFYTELAAFHPRDRGPRVSTYDHGFRPLGAVAWRREPWEAVHPPQGPPPAELLYSGAPDPRETPLVIPAWARAAFPELGDAIDRGLRLRRDAGLDT